MPNDVNVAEVRVYICSGKDKADDAEARLLVERFTTITREVVDVFNYDSRTFGGGTRFEGPPLGKFVVIGKK